ncbi:MAG: hypothetical protein L0H26_00255 [Microlunatus sp.]|nr:hypothetical protein [Microlunatus sp.]
MPYQHSNVYIVSVTDTDAQGETHSWFVGPYGSTRARQVAGELESVARGATEREEPGALRDRECFVEALFSDDDCLRVQDYGRAEHGSLY